MHRNLSNIPFDELAVGMFLGEGTFEITKDLIVRFARLMGYDDPVYLDREYARKTPYGDIITPPGMIFVYSLRLGWDLKVFPPGSIRMGDDNIFYQPAKPGDVLKTTLHISDRFIKKERKFVKMKLDTVNQTNNKICTVEFVAIIP